VRPTACLVPFFAVFGAAADICGHENTALVEPEARPNTSEKWLLVDAVSAIATDQRGITVVGLGALAANNVQGNAGTWQIRARFPHRRILRVTSWTRQCEPYLRWQQRSDTSRAVPDTKRCRKAHCLRPSRPSRQRMKSEARGELTVNALEGRRRGPGTGRQGYR